MFLIIILISAILTTLPFYFPDFFFLSFFSLVPLFLIIKKSGIRKSFLSGWFFGFIYFFISSYWLFYPLYNYSGLNIIFVIIILFFLFSLLGLFFGFWGYLLKYTGLGAVRVALSWTAVEFLRYKILGIFPVAYLGYTQSSFKTILQWADIGGVFLISFLILLINGYLFKLVNNKKKKFLVPILIIFILIGSYGIYKTNYNFGNEDMMSVGIIQTNIRQSEKWKTANIEKNITNIFSSASNLKNVELFITPETSLTFDITRNEYYRNQVLKKMNNFDAYFQFGAQSIKKNIDLKYNSSFLFNSAGEKIERYNKNRLVVFGEKIPFNKLVNKLTNKRWHSLTSGENRTLFKLEDKKWKNFICSEIFYPILEQDLTKFDFIVNQSNEAWFNNGLQQQMWAAAIFRAVESRKTVVKSGNRAISGVVFPSGRVNIMKSVQNNKELRSKVLLNNDKTFYSKKGNYIGYISLIITFLVLVINLIKNYRNRKNNTDNDLNEIIE